MQSPVNKIRVLLLATAAMLWLTAGPAAAEENQPPQVGQTAPDHQWQTPGGEKVKLSEVAAEGPVVLLMLRGYPGYQCPICTRQVADFVNHAPDFQRLGARVVLVYPGSANGLQQRAEEFLRGSTLPEPLTLVLDPDYAFTNLYGLRWDAPRETAYPSTFVLDENRVVKFAKISHSHGDRTKATDVVAVVEGMQQAQ